MDVIDLGADILIDRSLVRSPEIRLLLAAIGEEIAAGSPWVAVEKQTALLYQLTVNGPRWKQRLAELS